MIHLSETGLNAGRRLCFSQNGDSVHAMYAPLHNPEFRETVCLDCLRVWANEAYDDADENDGSMPDYIKEIRSSQELANIPKGQRSN